MTYILGIDPGLDGAAVRLAYGRLTGWLDFRPYLDATGSGIDATALYRALKAGGLLQGLSLIIIERPAARPASMGQGQGVASAFNFGHSCGLIYGLLAAGAPTARIIRPHPAVWKAQLGLPADKIVCTARAAELFPDSREIFYGARGGVKDGRAEAALLAYWGMRFKKISRLI